MINSYRSIDFSLSKNDGNVLNVLLHSYVKSWEIKRKNNIDFALYEIGESFYSSLFPAKKRI